MNSVANKVDTAKGTSFGRTPLQPSVTDQDFPCRGCRLEKSCRVSVVWARRETGQTVLWTPFEKTGKVKIRGLPVENSVFCIGKSVGTKLYLARVIAFTKGRAMPPRGKAFFSQGQNAARPLPAEFRGSLKQRQTARGPSENARMRFRKWRGEGRIMNESSGLPGEKAQLEVFQQ